MVSEEGQASDKGTVTSTANVYRDASPESLSGSSIGCSGKRSSTDSQTSSPASEPVGRVVNPLEQRADENHEWFVTWTLPQRQATVRRIAPRWTPRRTRRS